MYSRFAVALLAALTLAAVACGGVTDPSKNKTDTFTGTLGVNGQQSYVFNASNSGEYAVTLNSLTPAPSSSIFVGLAIGQNTTGGCVPLQTNAFSTIGFQALSGPITPGSWCVVIFDVGTLTQNENFSVAISHP